MRQSIKRKAKNLISRNKLKNLLRQERLLISQKNMEEAKKLLSQVFKSLDKAAKTGLIKANTAARRKSRLAKAIAKILS